MGTSKDSIMRGQVILHQPIEGYRAGVDALFLASAVPAKAKDRVLELGCGVGAAMLSLATRIDGVKIDGLELQPHLAELAQSNITANEFQDRMRVFKGDLLSPPVDLEIGHYDCVFANPPYMSDDRGNPPQNPSRRTAHVEHGAGLTHWVDTALDYCRHKGSVVFIYRADRLDEVIRAMNGKAGEITIIPLWSKIGDNAGRVIIRARKGIKTPLTLTSGIVLHNDDGTYSDAADAVLCGNLAL